MIGFGAIWVGVHTAWHLEVESVTGQYLNMFFDISKQVHLVEPFKTESPAQVPDVQNQTFPNMLTSCYWKGPLSSTAY